MDKSKVILGILDCIHTRSEDLLKKINEIDKEIYNDFLNESCLLEYNKQLRIEQQGHLEELLMLRMDIMELIAKRGEAE